ncbi:DUF4160 domain-containing protein [Peredibacter sp. HCB2-198]|uniref:DUF4160 domain-containing protein n=1 Tax=Peredibacter sp. HCB2-198 TaxID=3383025 RepID=UPI0038B46383
MPTIMMIYGFRFFFHSNEETRMHVHVEYQDLEAKIWLDTFEIAQNNGFRSHELNRIQKIVRTNEKAFKKAWTAYFG